MGSPGKRSRRVAVDANDQDAPQGRSSEGLRRAASKKREQEKQEARAKVDAEKNNAKGISECRDVGQLMRMHRANSERIEHMEEAQEKEAKRKEAERAPRKRSSRRAKGKLVGQISPKTERPSGSDVAEQGATTEITSSSFMTY